MQLFYEKEPANTFSEFKKAIEAMYENYPMEKIKDSFVTLQMVMNQVIDHLGGNDYKLDHLKKNCKKGGLNVFPGDVEGQVRFPDHDLPICLTVTPTACLWDGVEWVTDTKIPMDYKTD